MTGGSSCLQVDSSCDWVRGQPRAIQFRPSVLEKELACMRIARGREVHVRGENHIFHCGGPGDDASVGRTDEGLAGERDAVLCADPITKGNEVAVLKCRH